MGKSVVEVTGVWKWVVQKNPAWKLSRIDRNYSKGLNIIQVLKIISKPTDGRLEFNREFSFEEAEALKTNIL